MNAAWIATVQGVVAGTLATAGVTCLGVAVSHERRMQRHRRAGVSYSEVTLRRDGGWRRAELFTDEGLAHQRRASAWGITGAGLLVAALLAWVGIGWVAS